MKICPLCDNAYPDSQAKCPQDGAMLIGMRELPPGHIVRGKYKIIRKIGQGGMGTVYLADDTFLNCPMALKFLSGELSSDPSFTRRFRDEARATFRLRHPNIVEVTGLDQSEDGSLFIAMEFIEGASLRTLMEQAGGPFGIPRALHLVRGIASGLGAAHKAGFVHRDIKPENIVICERDGNEQPKILDFGIVASMEKAKAEEAEAERLSRAPILTAKYAAPEQWGFLRPEELDGRTDLYALGCVFYEMVAGRLPFSANSYEGWMGQHLKFEALRPSTFNPEISRYPRLDELVLWLIQKDRDHRPSGVQEFLAGLDSIKTEPPPVNKPPAKPFGSGTVMEVGVVRNFTPVPQQEPTVFDRPRIPIPAQHAPEKKAAGSQLWLVLSAVALLAIVLSGLGFYLLKHRGEPAQDTAKQPPQGDLVKPVPDTPVTKTSQSGPPNSLPGDPPNTIVPRTSIKNDPAPPDPTRKTKEAPPVLPASASDLERQGTAFYNQKDYAHAGKSYEQACTMNSAESCRLLADMYAKQQGFTNDSNKVADLRTQSCGEGDMAACYQLSFNYKLGEGVPKDNLKVESLRAKSCNGGYSEACTKLGALYMSEEGFKDQQKAALYFQKGCTEGSREGCWFLGKMYEIGQGLPKDPAKSKDLYRKSCQLGYAKACEDLRKP